jgi:hypothetical protein
MTDLLLPRVSGDKSLDGYDVIGLGGEILGRIQEILWIIDVDALAQVLRNRSPGLDRRFQTTRFVRRDPADSEVMEAFGAALASRRGKRSKASLKTAS